MLLRIKKWVRDFFGFTRAQTNGFLLLLPLMMVALFGQPLWRWYAPPPLYDTRADSVKLDSLVALWKTDSAKHTPRDADSRRFAFDPNKATVGELVSLGFPEKMATRIVHYRERGGKFRVKSDLLKIYGLDSAFYQNLQPYVQLPAVAGSKSRYKGDSLFNKERAGTSFAKTSGKPRRVRQDINVADTAALKAVFGIGTKLSLRIVKYRERLGGFVSMRQLSEIYALDTAVVTRLESSFFVSDNFKPRMINLNTASEIDMATHPYLGKRAANIIVAWRFQHGRLAGLNDLRTTKAVAERDFDNVAPYVTF